MPPRKKAAAPPVEPVVSEPSPDLEPEVAEPAAEVEPEPAAEPAEPVVPEPVPTVPAVTATGRGLRMARPDRRTRFQSKEG